MAWQRGHSWIMIAGAFLCVLRARFFRLEVRRFGTAISGHKGEEVQRDSVARRTVRNASQRRSVSGAQPQAPAFQSAPHRGQSP
jgi:hypothetical protein